jgi:predicted AlkP superfamily phosphohydrolase/phosphomutase
MLSGDENNPYRGVIETAYRSLDGAIDRLLKAAGPDTAVFVISEFGAGALQSGVQVNTWLQREGFLAYKKPPSPMDGRGTRKSGSGTGFRSWIAAARQAAQTHLPPAAITFANRHLKGVKSWVQSYLAGSDIDWARTEAFCRGKEGEIYINLKGRDPHGIVPPGEPYESVRDRIIERLMELTDPKTGQRAVERVYRREELYRGPLLEWAPDLVVSWLDGKYMPTESDREKDSVFVTRWREYMGWPTTGSHRIEGVLFARGPGIPGGIKISGAGIEDLLPTWFSNLNQEVPPGIEGRPIPELFGAGASKGGPRKGPF